MCFDEVCHLHGTVALQPINRTALVLDGPVLPQLELSFDTGDRQFEADDAAGQLLTQFRGQLIAPRLGKADS